jgi:GNAT superfamily N-acetyltransferase
MSGAHHVVVRPATVEDGPAIGDAHGSAWEAAYTVVFDEAFVAGAAQSRRAGWPTAMERLLTPPNLLLVAELDGRVGVFVHAGLDDDVAGRAEIKCFYAHPFAWGSGAAGLLMADVCSRLHRDYDAVMLWTMRDTPQSNRFYEKNGFSRTGVDQTGTVTNWETGEPRQAAQLQYAKVLDPPR